MKFLSAVFCVIVMLGFFTVKALPPPPPSPCEAACIKESRSRSHTCYNSGYSYEARIDCMRPVWQASKECSYKCAAQRKLEREAKLAQTTKN